VINEQWVTPKALIMQYSISKEQLNFVQKQAENVTKPTTLNQAPLLLLSQH
jgi:hypothetical protein